jgi:hypothetical protein
MRADIHDGQEHKRSIHGPDTEAQDQSSPSITFGLQHTAGPYRVTSVAPCNRRLPVNFRYAPLATEVVCRRNMSLRTNSGREQVQQGCAAEGAPQLLSDLVGAAEQHRPRLRPRRPAAERNLALIVFPGGTAPSRPGPPRTSSC